MVAPVDDEYKEESKKDGDKDGVSRGVCQAVCCLLFAVFFINCQLSYEYQYSEYDTYSYRAVVR